MRSDERQLEQRIGAAFDRLPDPDSTRLKEIEAGLIRRTSRRFRLRGRDLGFWWLIAALAATGAAAWWGGAYLSREAQRAPVPQQTGPSGMAPEPEGTPRRRAEPAGPAAPSGGQRQIYRRERF